MATDRDKGRGGDDLDRLFALAAQDTPSDALVARVLAGAEREHHTRLRPRDLASTAAGARGAARLRGFLVALGGWPAVTCVTVAGFIGLGLGYQAHELIDATIGGQIWTLAGDAGAVPRIDLLWSGEMGGGDVW